MPGRKASSLAPPAARVSLLAPKGGGSILSPETPGSDCWAEVRAFLEERLKEQAFKAYIRPITPLGPDRDGAFRLGVPSPLWPKILGSLRVEGRSVLDVLQDRLGPVRFVTPEDRQPPEKTDPEADLRRLFRAAGLSEVEAEDLLRRARRLIRQGRPPERVLEALDKPVRRLMARPGRSADPYALARHALELVQAEPLEGPIPADPAEAIAYVERNFQRHCPVGTLDARRTGRREVLTYTFRTEGLEATWTVNPSVQYGLPGPFEVELWYALLISTAARPKPVRNPVEADLPTLRRLLGLPKTGQSNRRILEALKRLASTHYASHAAFRWRASDDDVELVRDDRFVLIQRIETTETRSRRGSPTLRVRIWLNECVLDNLNRRHVAPLDADFYSSLRRPASRVLYIHLLPVLFAADGPEARVPYKALAAFAGLKEYKRPRDIRMQLKKLLGELIRRGFILGFELETGSDGGYVVVLRRNPDFPYQVVRPPTPSRMQDR